MTNPNADHATENRLPLDTFPVKPVLSFEAAMAVDYVVGESNE